ncbi:Calx-beta domain-containing protein [Caenimonas sp. SL110]|uniref:Calx-beta domain-containing protein n=1 Tax=Caenimonas sp. SL110 TaxID=1450524 RepID=UPI000654337C|nr:Calx-beta domain-containing protein [Caenimonas sp. SL110]
MPIYIRASDVFISENNGPAFVTVSLSEASASQVTVGYEIDSGTASYGSDYVFTSGTLTFAPGETSKTVQVTIAGDVLVESAELLYFSMYSPVNAVIDRTSSSIVVVDNETPTAAPANGLSTVSVQDIVIDEKAGTATFLVRLDRPATGSVQVDYATADMTAIAGSDYVSTSGSLVFQAGQTARVVTVALINDSGVEAAELFKLMLANPVGVLMGDATGVARIDANDGPTSVSPSIHASDVFVSEADGVAYVTVSLSSPSLSQVSVDYELDSDTASYGSDYVFHSGRLIFAPGDTSKQIAVAIPNDTGIEQTELLHLSLYGAVNGVIDRTSSSIVIVDNETPVSAPQGTAPVVGVQDLVVDEAAQMAQFVVRLDRPGTSTLTVQYATANMTATAGDDYVAQAGTLVFLAGETAKTISVPILNDATSEAGELFKLVLSGATGGTVGDATGVARIDANDAPATAMPTIAASDTQVSEADGLAYVTVSLSAPSLSQVSVQFELDSDTGAYGSDYIFQSGTLVFAAGETSKQLVIGIPNDTTVEQTELVQVNLYGAVNGVIGRTHASISIIDNETPVAAPQGVAPAVSVADLVVDEAGQMAQFVVRLDRPGTDAVTVQYATGDGTATAGTDYVAQTGTLVFLAGETAKTVSVPIFNDGIAESSELFKVVLSGVSGGTLGDATGFARIDANDSAASSNPLISASDVYVSEADGQAFVTVSLNAPSLSQVSVNYELNSDTGAYGSDYIFTSGTLSFAPGETSKQVAVGIPNDAVVEQTEQVQFSLYGAVNGSIGRSNAHIAIVDNETPVAAPLGGAPAISVADLVIDESGQVAQFIVRLDRPSAATVSVQYATADGSAYAGSDYVAQSGALVFLAGETAKTVSVPIINDTGLESDEMFKLVLGSPSGATIADNAGVARIEASDAPFTANPVIHTSDIYVAEEDGIGYITMSLNAPSLSLVSVNYELYSGTASYGADYVYQSGKIAFAPGETSKVVQVSIVNDVTAEPLQSLTIRSFGVVNATLDRPDATISILSNDEPTNSADYFRHVKAGSAGQSNLFDLGASPTNDFVFGTQDIDTVSYTGPRAAHSLFHVGDIYAIYKNDGSLAIDAMVNVERLSFTDTRVALDLDGNAGIAAKVLGAVVGTAALPSIVGIALGALDAGMSYETLMTYALEARLGAGASNGAVFDLLYTNLAHSAPSQADHNYYTGLLDGGYLTQAQMGVIVAELPLNAMNIGLAGLHETGLDYV